MLPPCRALGLVAVLSSRSRSARSAGKAAQGGGCSASLRVRALRARTSSRVMQRDVSAASSTHTALRSALELTGEAGTSVVSPVGVHGCVREMFEKLYDNHPGLNPEDVAALEASAYVPRPGYSPGTADVTPIVNRCGEGCSSSSLAAPRQVAAAVRSRRASEWCGVGCRRAQAAAVITQRRSPRRRWSPEVSAAAARRRPSRRRRPSLTRRLSRRQRWGGTSTRSPTPSHR